jgi:hypothetical protein
MQKRQIEYLYIMSTIGQYRYKANKSIRQHLGMVDAWCGQCQSSPIHHKAYLSPTDWHELREAIVFYNTTFASLGFKTQHNSNFDKTRLRPVQIGLKHITTGATLQIFISQ